MRKNHLRGHQTLHAQHTFFQPETGQLLECRACEKIFREQPENTYQERIEFRNAEQVSAILNALENVSEREGY